MKSFELQQINVPLLSLIFVSFISGCATMDSTSVTNFATSVTAVKTQADDALNSVASLTRGASVTYAASQPTLNEANFVYTPTEATISEWDGAFSSLETYAQNLSALLSPNAANNFDVAATNLYNQFNQTAQSLHANGINSGIETSPLLATAFTQVANAIISAKEQATAFKVASATDTNIATICDLFATEIGADPTAPGLRKTVYETVWTPRLASLSTSFLAATNTFAVKLSLSQQYSDALAAREAQDQILAGLRRSILALSDAHHTLAQGKPASIQADLAVVESEIQQSRNLYNQFSSTTKQ
jgi:hypothetical protein